MQLDSGRGGGAQHILEWGIFGLIFRREAGVLLLKDWQSQHITRRGEIETNKSAREKQKNNNTRTVVSDTFSPLGADLAYFPWHWPQYFSTSFCLKVSLNLQHHVSSILMTT